MGLKIVIAKNKLYIVNIKILVMANCFFLWDLFPQTSEDENEWI